MNTNCNLTYRCFNKIGQSQSGYFKGFARKLHLKNMRKYTEIYKILLKSRWIF